MADQAQQTGGGFLDFLMTIKDDAKDLAGIYIQEKMQADTEKRYGTVPGVGTYQQGLTAPFGVVGAESQVNVLGLFTVNRTVALLAGGAVVVALVLRASR